MAAADGTGSIVSEAGDDREAHASGLLDDAVGLTHELREALHDQLTLLSHETQRAAWSLAAIIAAGIGIGVLLASTWLGLGIAGALTLIGLGLPPAMATLIVVTLNLVALLVPYELIRRRVRNLGFPSTLRTLQPAAERSGARQAA